MSAYHLISFSKYRGGGDWSTPQNEVIDMIPAAWIIERHRAGTECVVHWATEISKEHYDALKKLEFIGAILKELKEGES